MRAPRLRTVCTLMGGVVVGMTMSAETPSRRPASATPWAWLPAEAAMTPFSFAFSGRL